MTIQLNSEFSQMSVVTSTAAPSGSPFTATDVVENSEFCFNPPLSFEEYEINVSPMMWRIYVQIAAVQVQEYKKADDQEKLLCKQRILNTLILINKQALMFKPSEIPTVTPPCSAYSVQNVTRNWCYVLMSELTEIFTNVSSADILKIN